MAENEQLITKSVVYICPPVPLESKEVSDAADNKKNAIKLPFADKIKLPDSKIGKVVAGGAVGAAAFALLPAGILGAAAAGGVAAGVAGIAALTKKEKGKSDISNIQSIPVDIAEDSFKNAGIKLRNIDRIETGLILAKHPFLPDTYINIDSTETELFHLKMLCLSTITQYLGAKSISGHARVVEQKQRVCDAKGNISYKGIKALPSVNIEQNQRYESEYRLEDTFSGEYDMSSYKKAIEEAAKFGLDKDIEIENLIQQRNPENARSIQSRKVSIELSRELNKVLDIAFNLEATGIELGIGYKDILESCKKVIFELDIQF